MAQRNVRLYGSAAILQRLLKALIWAGVVAYLFYVMTEVRPARISLAAEPPAAVSLADSVRRTDMHERNEVNVIGRLDSRDGVPVTEDDKTEQLFLFFAPDSGPDDTVVRAAVLIEPEELKIYLEELAAYPDENRVGINGRVLQLPKLARVAERAIEERGLTLSDQFVYITPWLGDRRDPLDNGPWFDLVLIGLCTLAVLYQLYMAIRWYRNDRAVMSILTDDQIAAYRRSMRGNRTTGNSLFLLVLAVVVIAFVVSRYR
ncbi:MAG: hypothetical protein HC844_18975 [Tabrizicola sp.]|nr:hypothetical protein [Tabrizicola sp.]